MNSDGKKNILTSMFKSKAQQGGESDNFYQLVLNSIDDYAVFTTDRRGFVNSWNTGAEQVLGYSAEEIMGKNSAVFFTAADLKKSADKKELRNAKKNGSAIDERYHVRKDGSVFWASGKTFPLFDSDGKHLGFTKVMRNLDERKAAEEQLSQIKNYAEAIVANSRQPILVLTNDMRIYAANNAFYNLFKLNKKISENRFIDKIGNGLFNIPELAELLEQVTKSGRAVENFLLDHEWPSLGRKLFVINANKFQHQINFSNFILFSIEDITEHKSLEQQKDDFITIASHEIRTPITVIKAYAQIIQKRAAEVNDQFMAATAGKVNEKTEKLMSMVSYLLDTSQLELGDLIIKKNNFDIVDLINESINELKLIDNHSFIVKGKKSSTVFADRVRISQVLNNLLNNASKYSPSHMAITVSVKTNKKGDKIIISVSDKGIGIPKSEQANLFKRFWRASSATSRNIAGIGLGLHVSKALIKQHGGNIWLKSEKEKGSIFSFSLPLNNLV
jgi:PAS domain S-box-containing protein